jgi:hypothetical protein
MKTSIKEWMENNPPKCRRCNKVLQVGFEFYGKELNKITDTDGERLKGFYCSDCNKEQTEALEILRFVEVYKNNRIYCKEGRYQPYWGSSYHFNSLEECRLFIDYRINQLEEARKIKDKWSGFSNVRKEVSEFAKAMDDKLTAREAKYNGWDDCSIDFLTYRLRQEMAELFEALRLYHIFPSDDTKRRVEDECSDVGNFSMMIRDKVLKGGK